MLHTLRDLDDERLRAPHRLVLAMMLAYREGDGSRVTPERRGAAAPSVRSLVRCTRLGESTVHRVLADLRAWGYLAIRRPGHHHAAPVYDLVLDSETSPDETSQTETSHGESQGSRSESEGVSLEESGVSQRDHLRISLADHLADHSADPPPSESAGAFRLESPTAESTKAAKADVSIEAVWSAYLAAWRRTVGKGAEPRLTAKRIATIRSRVREGYSAGRIAKAIESLFASEFHRGANDRGKTFLEIEQVIRAGERIEMFEGRSATGARGANGVRQAPAEDAEWRQEW